MVTAMDFGSVYLTSEPAANIGADNLSDSFTIVRVDAVKIDHNIDKPLTAIPLPRTSNEKSTSEPDTTIVDIGRAKQAITVTGVLIDDSTSTALTKKNNLITLATRLDGAGTVTVIWGQSAQSVQQKFTCNFTKVQFSETPGIYNVGGTSEREAKFDVQILLVVGTGRASG